MTTDARVPLKAQRTNQPYAPTFYPELRGEWRRLFVQFLKFCERITIQSKEEGPKRLLLKLPQRYLIEEIFWGFQQGIHDFVIVKARQLGATTILEAFDLFWTTRFSLQGMVIFDDESNKEIHRDIIQEMYQSVVQDDQESYRARGAKARLWSRGPLRVKSRLELAYRDQPGWAASRIMWAFANKAKSGNLGRSRGANYLHCEEMDSWGDQDAPASLDAARAARHPYRAYFWVGTGQGYSLLYDLWEQAKDSISSKAIFVGFWRDPEKIVTREQRALWAAYGREAWTADETEWREEVKRRYAYLVTKEQLAWWRWALAEGKGINGDLQKMLQEHPWYPEHAFQAVGKAFVSPPTVLRMLREIEQAPTPKFYRYEWGQYFDSHGDDALIEVDPEAKDAATLTIWEEPQPESHAVYVVGGDPAYGSSPKADLFCAGVFRAYPDALIQVAEYATPLGTTYQFAWVLAHLCGVYHIEDDTFWALDVNGPGRAVMEEIARMLNSGFGISQPGRRKIQDAMNGMRRFLERRVDSMTEAPAWQFHATEQNRMQMFQQLRDSCERGALVLRGHKTAAEINALTINDNGWIQPGGILNDDRAFVCGLANRTWLQNVIPEIEDRVAPKTPPRDAPRHVGESLLRGFLQRVDKPEEQRVRPYGIQTIGPGRGRL